MSAYNQKEGDLVEPRMMFNPYGQHQVTAAAEPAQVANVARRLQPSSELPPAPHGAFPSIQLAQQNSFAHVNYGDPGDETDEDTEIDWNFLSYQAPSNGFSSAPQPSIPQTYAAPGASNFYDPVRNTHAYAFNGNLSRGLTASFDTSLIDTHMPSYYQTTTQGAESTPVSTTQSSGTQLFNFRNPMENMVNNAANYALEAATGTTASQSDFSVTMDQSLVAAGGLASPPGRFRQVVARARVNKHPESSAWTAREISALNTVAAWALVKLKDYSFDDRWSAMSTRLASHFNVHRTGLAAYRKYARLDENEGEEGGKRKRSSKSASTSPAPEAGSHASTPVTAPAKKLAKVAHDATPQGSIKKPSKKARGKKARGKMRVSEGTPSFQDRLYHSFSTQGSDEVQLQPAHDSNSVANSMTMEQSPQIQLRAVGQKVVDTFTKHTGVPLPANWEIVLDNVVAKYAPYVSVFPSAQLPSQPPSSVASPDEDDHHDSSAMIKNTVVVRDKEMTRKEYDAWCAHVEATGDIGAKSFLYEKINYVPGAGYPDGIVP